MQVTKLPNADIEITVDLREFRVIGQCLNECVNGFGVRDFPGRIGADEETVDGLREQMYQARCS
jgi:hypothetical protein